MENSSLYNLGDTIDRLVFSYNRANFLFRQIRHMAIQKPHKRNYPYWKGYPYDKDGINIVKMVDVKCDFASGNDYTAIRGNGKIQIIENK